MTTAPKCQKRRRNCTPCNNGTSNNSFYTFQPLDRTLIILLNNVLLADILCLLTQYNSC